VGGAAHKAVGETASVPVARVGSRIEAELIVGMLRSNGLSAVVSADDAGGQEPQLQIEGVRVLVTPSDEASARRLLAAADEKLGPGVAAEIARALGERYEPA
jgi:Putative prokaryotic signal transducing protein